ncbi:MAG: aldehyde dehydrogenase family protein [Verrucomicrobia bacterium]|nr:aldehyde dehydrogenase family protein [Verrucomicrobiota bacterium]
MADHKLTVVSPFDLSELETLVTNSAADVERCLSDASRLASGSPLPVWERVEILEKAAALLDERKDSFAMTIAKEGGKPLKDAEVEAARAVQGIRNAVEVLHSEDGKTVPMGLNPASSQRLAFTIREPIGVVVAISAFNHPLNLIIHQVVPAVAVGCPVIIKPAAMTPLSCIHFVDLLYECGLPEEWCQILLLSNEDSEILVTDSRVAFFSFIGSSQVGWYLRSKLAPGTRCALEHGGAAPVIVEPDANLDSMIPSLVKGGYYHAGQVCVSVQRVFAHTSIVDELEQQLKEHIETLVSGDPSLPETDVGPLILPREADRVEEWVNEAKSMGTRVILGGNRISETCFEPTLLRNAPANTRVSQMEIFGPVVSLTSYSEMNEAIEQANALPVAFQASVFTQDIDRAMRAAKKLSASAVMINDHTAFRVDWMPFAGRKTSGLGIGGIPFTMEDLTQEKMIVIKSPAL